MSSATAEKEFIFNELYTECCLAGPSARLSHGIRCRLETFSREERKELVSTVKEGCPPLFVACKEGNVQIMQYLIEQCDADIDQRGVYEVPEDKHIVTPLWWAAVRGKLDIVRWLVEHGANVNGVSDSGSTPVRSACFVTHYEIVVYLVENNADISKPNCEGHTCLMTSVLVQSVPLCNFLIQHGADVNAQDYVCSKTALHFAIMKGKFETTRLLLENGADPCIISSSGDDALQTACLSKSCLEFDYLCKKYCYSRERLAEAHELIGSMFLESDHDITKCLYYWHTALGYRQTDIPKRCVCKAPYGFIKEFQTLEELKNISLDLDALRMQSLLMCERILGVLHEDFIWKLRIIGALFADTLRYQQCINLWKYALEMAVKKHSLLHHEVCTIAENLVQIFFQLIKKSAGKQKHHEKINFEDVLESIRILVNNFEEVKHLLSIFPIFKKQQENFDNVLCIVCYQLYILYISPKTVNQILIMKQLIRFIMHIEPRTSTGDTLLHLVVSKSNILRDKDADLDLQSIFPHVGVLELMLECGANVKTMNCNLNTPLHVAEFPANFNSKIVQILHKYEACIDGKNGKSIQDDANKQRMHQEEINLSKSLAGTDLGKSELTLFSYEDLRVATRNFCNKSPGEGGCKIGEGGFGYVYKADMLNSSVAVKKLKDNIDDQFVTELNILSKFKHKNLLQLIGFSLNGPNCCLVYEYISNGSLYDRLACKDHSAPIPWKTRLDIAYGSALGINHLHTYEEMPMVHRDIKSANILLDEHFVPKVGDFGLVRIGGLNTSTMAVTRHVCGTSVYMAREAYFGDVSVKLDSFSFGVVLLELITGLPPFDIKREDRDLKTHVESCDITSLFDRKIRWRNEPAIELFRIAKLCLIDKKKERPSILQILEDLWNCCNNKFLFERKY